MLRILVFVIAMGASGLTVWLLNSGAPDTAGAVTAAQPAKPALDEILVAAADLPHGKVLEESDLRWQSWPKEAVASTYLTREAKPDATNLLKGSIVRSRIVAGEPMLQEKLMSGSANLLASMLPAGKRAIAIRVSAESTAGGFILPDDRVDVIHTAPSPGSEAGRNTSYTLLSDIRVLAVDQQAAQGQGQGQGQAVIGKTVTLELNQAQAEIVATGQASGTLSLALRSLADNGTGPDPVRIGSAVRMIHGGRMEFVDAR